MGRQVAKVGSMSQCGYVCAEKVGRGSHRTHNGVTNRN